MQQILNYINGKLIPPASGNFIDNYNPAEGKIYSKIADSGEEDVAAAVIAASAAFPAWSNTSPEKRCEILLKVADLIDRNLDKLALAESIDQGKPVKLARTLDIPRASANIKFFATAANHFASEIGRAHV